jgi:hypothetical protein
MRRGKRRYGKARQSISINRVMVAHGCPRAISLPGSFTSQEIRRRPALPAYTRSLLLAGAREELVHADDLAVQRAWDERFALDFAALGVRDGNVIDL